MIELMRLQDERYDQRFKTPIAFDYVSAPPTPVKAEVSNPRLSDPLVLQYLTFAIERLKSVPQENPLWDLYARGLKVTFDLADSTFRPQKLAVESTGETEMLFSLFGFEKRGADIWVDAESEAVLFVPMVAGKVEKERRIPSGAGMRSLAGWLERLRRLLFRRSLVPEESDRVFRGYRAGHVVKEHGQTRLSSGLFRDSNGVSVYDGALCTAEVVLASLQRSGATWGLVTVTKQKLADLGATLTVNVQGADADDPAREAHCLLKLPKKGVAAELAACALVHFHAPGAEYIPTELQ